MMKSAFISCALFILAMMASCSSDEPKSKMPSDSCYDFVTYIGVQDNSSYFTLQKSEDSPVVTYHCPQLFKKDSGVEEGDRLIIAYTPAEHSEPYISGKIELYGIRLLDNTSKGATVVEPDALDLQSDKIRMLSLTRTGSFINMQLQLFCAVSADPKKLELRTDQNEVDKPYPTLYVVYEAEKAGENPMTGYASFDISQIWELPTCQGVIISYSGTTATFNK